MSKYLIISGSIAPTYCGIGKFAARIFHLLTSKRVQVFYLTNKEQPEFNPQDKPLEIEPYTGNLLAGGLDDVYKVVKKIRPQIVNIQYQTFAKNYWDVFFPLAAKLAYPKVKVISTIHEFDGFTLKGKIRNTLAILFSDKVLFSDQTQLTSASKFTCGLFDKKFTTIITGINTDLANHTFTLPDFKDNHLHIAYHGYIQPTKGLDFLLKALSNYSYPFTLHILGDFKTMLNYTNLEEVQNYQKFCLNLIENSKSLKKNLKIWGDVEPGSPKFKEILQQCHVAILPFTDYLTFRRTTFINVLLNSNCVMVSTFDPRYSEPELASVCPIKPKSEESILNFLNNWQQLSLEQKVDLFEKQMSLRKYLTGSEIKEETLQKLLC